MSTLDAVWRHLQETVTVRQGLSVRVESRAAFLGTSRVLVLLAVARHQDVTSGPARPRDIAALTGLSLSATRNRLAGLARDGWLVRCPGQPVRYRHSTV